MGRDPIQRATTSTYLFLRSTLLDGLHEVAAIINTVHENSSEMEDRDARWPRSGLLCQTSGFAMRLRGAEACEDMTACRGFRPYLVFSLVTRSSAASRECSIKRCRQKPSAAASFQPERASVLLAGRMRGCKQEIMAEKQAVGDGSTQQVIDEKHNSRESCSV